MYQAIELNPTINNIILQLNDEKAQTVSSFFLIRVIDLMPIKMRAPFSYIRNEGKLF